MRDKALFVKVGEVTCKISVFCDDKVVRIEAEGVTVILRSVAFSLLTWKEIMGEYIKITFEKDGRVFSGIIPTKEYKSGKPYKFINLEDISDKVVIMKGLSTFGNNKLPEHLRGICV